jgi:CubicO group peptidase (beta-lactamase class C family)
MRKALIISFWIFITQAQTTAQDFGKGVDSILISYLDTGFSGIALVIQNNKKLLDKAYGYADHATKRVNTTKTLFNVASIGKQFTAVVVLKLEEQGLLNTKDYISKYTGKLGGAKDSATIEHLLLHSSGLFVEGIELDYSSKEKFIASVSSTPLESTPGTRHRYSNAGYTMLAAVVEIVTRKPFEAVVRQLIFKPAKMKFTGYPWESQVKHKFLATGYDSKDSARPAETNIWGNRGPGHQVTNNRDMRKWYNAWNDGRLISRQIKSRALTDQIPGRETYGWNKLKLSNGDTLYAKGGGRRDFESQSMWVPERNLYIFFVINRDKNLRRLIYRDLLNYLNSESTKK